MSHSASSAPEEGCSSSKATTSLPQHDEYTDSYERTLQSILCPSRLHALDSSDVPPIPYNTYSFFSYIATIHGRNFSMLLAPLVLLFLWGLGWWIIFYYDWIDSNGAFQEYMASQSGLVNPLVTPLSFLMTFRLGRAAVRWWEVSTYDLLFSKCLSFGSAYLST
jgi:hypothetical protein